MLGPRRCYRRRRAADLVILLRAVDGVCQLCVEPLRAVQGRGLTKSVAVALIGGDGVRGSFITASSIDGVGVVASSCHAAGGGGGEEGRHPAAAWRRRR